MVRRVIGCSVEDTSIFGWRTAMIVRSTDRMMNRRSVTVSGKGNSSPGSE